MPMGLGLHKQVMTDPLARQLLPRGWGEALQVVTRSQGVLCICLVKQWRTAQARAQDWKQCSHISV